MGVTILGWVAAVSSPAVSVPQLWKLLRTRATAGVSLLLWQLSFMGAIAWTIHGVWAGRVNLIATNVCNGVLCGLVLAALWRQRHLGLLRVFGPPVLVGAAVGLVDRPLTDLVFGLLMVVPQVAGQLFQSADLIRSPDIRGVAAGYLWLNFACQVLWVSWAGLAGDNSIVVAGTTTGLAIAANLTLYYLRQSGRLAARPGWPRRRPDPVMSEPAEGPEAH